jgi:hypothetical protein
MHHLVDTADDLDGLTLGHTSRIAGWLLLSVWDGISPRGCRGLSRVIDGSESF